MDTKPWWSTATDIDGIALDWLLELENSALPAPGTWTNFQAWLNADARHPIAYQQWKDQWDWFGSLAPFFGRPVPEKKLPS
jgi:ferric-dicitrate binding protein FerR (iron transport regulator)